MLTITTRESCKKLWDALGDQEITFSIKKRVIPRSLNANNYAWSLIEKLAVAVKSDKDSVYEEMLRRYGTGETYTDRDRKRVQGTVFSAGGSPSRAGGAALRRNRRRLCRGEEVHSLPGDQRHQRIFHERNERLSGRHHFRVPRRSASKPTPPSKSPDTRRHGIREESLLRLLRSRD